MSDVRLNNLRFPEGRKTMREDISPPPPPHFVSVSFFEGVVLALQAEGRGVCGFGAREAAAVQDGIVGSKGEKLVFYWGGDRTGVIVGPKQSGTTALTHPEGQSSLICKSEVLPHNFSRGK